MLKWFMLVFLALVMMIAVGLAAIWSITVIMAFFGVSWKLVVAIWFLIFLATRN